MRLTTPQKLKVLEWIAEGLQTDDINERAAQCEPAFSVSRQQVDFYRDSRQVKIGELKQQAESAALTSGIALKTVRVEKLQRLADRLELDLFQEGKFWVREVKGIGQGDNFQVVEQDRFNMPEVEQYRKTLDDVAKEMGDRRTINEVSGVDGGPIEHVVIYIPDNGRNTP